MVRFFLFLISQVLSKKCKDQKKKKKKMEEKCEFGPWSAWSDCQLKERKREREVGDKLADKLAE